MFSKLLFLIIVKLLVPLCHLDILMTVSVWYKSWAWTGIWFLTEDSVEERIQNNNNDTTTTSFWRCDSKSFTELQGSTILVPSITGNNENISTNRCLGLLQKIPQLTAVRGMHRQQIPRAYLWSQDLLPIGTASFQEVVVFWTIPCPIWVKLSPKRTVGIHQKLAAERRRWVVRWHVP
jgi:hypothetical protein